MISIILLHVICLNGIFIFKLNLKLKDFFQKIKSLQGHKRISLKYNLDNFPLAKYTSFDNREVADLSFNYEGSFVFLNVLLNLYLKVLSF